MERGSGIVMVLAVCAMLALVAGLAGCDSDPTPRTPVPLATTTISLLPGRTPRPTVVIRPLRANPPAITREEDLEAALLPVVDGTYCATAWSGTTFPATIALPVEPVRGDLLLEWNSSGNSDYIRPPDAPTYGIPANYTISTSADSTDGRDGTWRQVVSVKDNAVRTRAHRFPFVGGRWVRMTVTGAVPGPLGEMFAIDEIDLHDASDGTDDTIFFLGDSITVAAFTRCQENGPSLAELVNRASPGRFPAMIDGGVSGINSGYGVSVIQDWLTLNPDFRVWAIGYGTNDAWQQMPPAVFETHLQTLIDRARDADRIPIIARIPFAARGPADADVRALNEVIDRVATFNGLLPGPDLYAWFSAHPEELSEDGVHPTGAGNRSINRLWYEALRPLYRNSP